MLLTLFKDSQVSFVRALDEFAVAYLPETDPRLPPGVAGLTVSVDQLAEAPQLAAALVAWRQARRTRSILLTLVDHSVVELKGRSGDEVRELLAQAMRVSIVDVGPPDAA